MLRIKDPTAWFDDLNVYLADDELRDTAALFEPDLVFRGSKAGAVAWLSLVGIAGGAFGAVTLSPAIRDSAVGFAAYLLVAFVLLKGLGPATLRLTSRPVVWIARQTFFWAVLLGCLATLAAGIESPSWSYGAALAGGFFVGMMTGSLTPNSIKDEDSWMSAALPAGIVAALAATAIQRFLGGDAGTVGLAVLVGGAAGGLLFAPMSALLFRLWDEAHGFKRMATLYLHNDNFASNAVTYLDKALALTPDDPDLYNLRGVAWSKMGQPDRAAVDWKRAWELRPKDAEPLMNLGVDHLRREEFGEALEAFGAALGLDPDNARIHLNLGTAHERKGDLDEAIQAYGRAIELRPDYATAFSSRGYARFRKGDHQGAVADCDEALEHDPGLAVALVNRGHALAALDRTAEAADSYRSALDSEPDPKTSAEAMRGLEQLAERAGFARAAE